MLKLNNIILHVHFAVLTFVIGSFDFSESFEVLKLLIMFLAAL